MADGGFDHARDMLSKLLHAQWSHIDLERRSWHLPATKTTSRLVPLSQAVIDIINELPVRDGYPRLIPNLETGKPLVLIKHG